MSVRKYCQICGVEYYVRLGRADISKYCSNVCRYKRKLSDDAIRRISNSSSEKFTKNPNLRVIVSENGRRVIEQLRESGKAYKMPSGSHHTPEHKQYMSNLMRGREISWAHKISENHWSKSDQRDIVLNKILSTRRSNEYVQSPEYRNRLATWSVENLDKMFSRFKRGKCFNKTTGIEEWYRSSYERMYMDKLNNMPCVSMWTTTHGIVIPYMVREKQYRYFPDFLVKYDDGRIEIVETKGWVNDAESFDAKCFAGELYCNERGYVYRVLYKKEIVSEWC